MYPDRVHNAQRVLRAFAGYAGPIDGKAGNATLAAVLRAGLPRIPAGWSGDRRAIAAAQALLSEHGFDAGPADGLYGPQTDAAYEAFRRPDDMPSRSRDNDFGRQADVARRFGAPGAVICTAGTVVPPWRMVLAWDETQPITRFHCHAEVADSAQRAFDRVAEWYSPAQIHDLGLHLYGGCYQYRNMRGGQSFSMHAYGLAIDFDPARNRLKWGADQARLAKSDARKFWDIWEAEGWTSLGRARNYDWMHVQAVTL